MNIKSFIDSLTQFITKTPLAPSTTDKPNFDYLLATCQIHPNWKSQAQSVANLILKNRERYEEVEGITGFPWEMLGTIHALESGCDFRATLHNGERIIGTGRKTTIVPIGKGPFERWETAAIDAVHSQGSKFPLWGFNQDDPKTCLEFLEKYNGLGYRKKKIYSPYLWSGTNHYSSGKYVADGRFDYKAVSGQVGAVAILMTLGFFKNS